MKNPFNISDQPEGQPYAAPEGSHSDRIELAPIATEFAAMEHEGAISALYAIRSLFPGIKSSEGIYDPTRPSNDQNNVHSQVAAGNYTVAQAIDNTGEPADDYAADPYTFYADEPRLRKAAANDLQPLTRAVRGVGTAEPYIGKVVATQELTSEDYVKGLSDLGTIDEPPDNTSNNFADLRMKRVDEARRILDSAYDQGMAA